MTVVTQVKPFLSAIPGLIRELPQRLDEFNRLRDTVLPLVSPVLGSSVAKFIGRRTPWTVHAAVFGGGFVAGAVAASFATPMAGKDLRARIRREATAAWRRATGDSSTTTADEASPASAEASSGDDALAKPAADAVVPIPIANASGSDDPASAAMRGTALVDVAVVTPGVPPLAELTKDELYQKARNAEIEGRSNMDKAELIDALRTEVN